MSDDGDRTPEALSRFSHAVVALVHLRDPEMGEVVLDRLLRFSRDILEGRAPAEEDHITYLQYELLVFLTEEVHLLREEVHELRQRLDGTEPAPT